MIEGICVRPKSVLGKICVRPKSDLGLCVGELSRVTCTPTYISYNVTLLAYS